ncbi:hypothetical protein M2161_004249 [Streptomyces sp. SAI-133]|uniref:hypothetical protein n=1 Tax=unclassified Streptomyces TaxID=2593676 RepID=UPI00247409F4|nr:MULTISPECIES: hypothetical protein [unclassified Streptomyces]MDH6550834.1 hypothetical protein [Streptomyces sp. SAI-041]MDH6585143.1 hypothetical protein [Streptomyces sp. SAI-133]
MPLFRRAVWPRDHRDELVAGALVGAVVIVLGYASGIGAPGAAEAAVPPAQPPATTAPTTEESLGQPVTDLLDVDSYVKMHTVWAGHMLMPTTDFLTASC